MIHYKYIKEKKNYKMFKLINLNNKLSLFVLKIVSL